MFFFQTFSGIERNTIERTRTTASVNISCHFLETIIFIHKKNTFILFYFFMKTNKFFFLLKKYSIKQLPKTEQKMDEFKGFLLDDFNKVGPTIERKVWSLDQVLLIFLSPPIISFYVFFFFLHQNLFPVTYYVSFICLFFLFFFIFSLSYIFHCLNIWFYHILVWVIIYNYLCHICR